MRNIGVIKIAIRLYTAAKLFMAYTVMPCRDCKKL